jgi:hypothetical protein
MSTTFGGFDSALEADRETFRITGASAAAAADFRNARLLILAKKYPQFVQTDLSQKGHTDDLEAL